MTMTKGKSKNNRLLMFLLQNRVDDFIKQFEVRNNRCSMEIYSLYRAAYANKILLGDSEWETEFMPIIEKGRRENNAILDYLGSIIHLSEDFHVEFMKSLKSFAWFEEESDFDIMLDDSLENLKKKGYREIDCRLYEAGLKFNFHEFMRLLNEGGNPYARISALSSPEIAANMNPNMDDVYSLYDDVCRHACDSCDIYGIGDTWKDGFNCNETTVTQELLREFFQSAGFQLIINMVRSYVKT